MRILLISLFDEWCLGMRSISSIVRRAGHDAALIHLRSMPELLDDAAAGDTDGYHRPPASVTGADFRALCGYARDYAPDLIGLGVSFSNLSDLAIEVTRRLREAVPGVPIIWGGADATANPDVSIEHADIVCVGEGEGAIGDLLSRLAAGTDYSDIPNLWVRRNGRVTRNEVRPLITDLDALPWADFDFRRTLWVSGGEVHRGKLPPGSHLERSFPVMATRGCPYSCNYCCNSLYRKIYGAKDFVRHRSVEGVIAEIAHHIEGHHGVRAIEFHDDVFGLNHDWLARFAEEYPRRIGLPFFCYTYPVMCRPEFVALIRKAGVGVVGMGLQTGSDRVLRDIYGRHSTREKVIRSCALLQEAGIPLVIDLIGGNPLETEEDRMATLRLLLDLPPGSFVTHDTNYLAFYRNYPITEMAAGRGLIAPFEGGRNVSVVDPDNNYRFWHAIYQLPQFPMMDRAAILKMVDDPFLRANPDVVESIARSLIDATFLPGTRMSRDEQARLVTAELQRLKGSRAVRGYLLAKDWFSKAGRR